MRPHLQPLLYGAYVPRAHPYAAVPHLWIVLARAKMGLGTQQIEDALHQMLPEDVAIIRMDADSTRGKDAHKKLLEQFDAADCAVLLGTQMIAKGLDFPEVTLVGVVNADFALKLPDFRAGERAYDLRGRRLDVGLQTHIRSQERSQRRRRSWRSRRSS